jgi:SAM-dependent methyltransferase
LSEGRGSQEPSAWVERWAGELAPGSDVLDLACGAGRHARLFAALGHRVTAVDRDPRVRAWLADVPQAEIVVADLEGAAWPLPGRRFGAVVVTNYLHRPSFAHLLDALGHRGMLIYETFASGNERFGRPSNPDFLLRNGELLELVRGRLQVLGYENLLAREPRPAMVQRLCAQAL